MKVLLKTLGVIATIVTVVLGAALIGSRNGVNIYSKGITPAVETVANMPESGSENVTASDSGSVNSSEVIESDSVTGTLDNESKTTAKDLEENETDEQEIPNINKIDDLIELINKSSENLEKEFLAKINSKLNMDTLLEDIPEDEIRYLTTISYSAKIAGDDITATFKLEYKDHFSVIRAYNDKDLLPLLSGNEKDLLKKSGEILSEIIEDGMSDYEKEKAIHDYLVANYQYDNKVNTGNFTNLSYSGYGLLFNGIGVCDAYARIMYIMANMSGVECLYVVGYAGGVTENYGHAWNKIKIDGAWYNVDVTWDDPLPDEKGRVLYDYFNVTDEYLSKDHIWNKEFYPAAITESPNL